MRYGTNMMVFNTRKWSINFTGKL